MEVISSAQLDDLERDFLLSDIFFTVIFTVLEGTVDLEVHTFGLGSVQQSL